MWYLIEQYIVFVALAFFIGLIVGWWTTDARKSSTGQ